MKTATFDTVATLAGQEIGVSDWVEIGQDRINAFADATGERWFRSAWRNKLGAGFSVSMGPSGDKLSTLHYFFTLAMQHGMIWAGLPDNPLNDQGINRLSSYSGAMGQAANESPEVAPNAADKL